ncbi:hypothetical protein [Flavobacterium sp. 25HG05S-40]|uniref:hypothetical protein n=1 Tax=Flavobacterium sp. 25HG05S-40 TaxID=3458682 RepID=UPI004044065E
METKKFNREGKLNLILGFIVAIFVLVSLTSCAGTRSTSTSSVKKNEAAKETLNENQKSIDTTSTKKEESSTENVKKNTVVEKTEEGTKTVETIEPINPDKPASYIDDKGQKKELNNAKHTKTTETNNKKETQKEAVSQEKKDLTKETEQKGISDEMAKEMAKESSKAEEDNKRDTFRFSINFLWIIIILTLIIAGWLAWRRYKRIWPFKP